MFGKKKSSADPASTGAATCCDEKQILRQKEDAVLTSNIGVLLLASVWGCDGGGVGVCVSVVLVSCAL